MKQLSAGQANADPADVLTVGLGTATAMWIAGYVLHMPAVAAPPAATFFVLLVVLALGGAALGRYTQRTWRGATATGVLVAVVNLLVLGSVLAEPGPEAPGAALWLPGYFAGTVAVMLGGYAVGRRRPATRAVHWPMGLGGVAVAATALVVTAGGLVTGFEAGFSVPDWPASFGFNMFALPLSRMTGGIYYEHAHRLAGTLVGLVAIALAVYLLMRERRGWVKILAVAAFILVCLQGLAGGLWVVRVEQTAPVDEQVFRARPNLAYMLFHGTFGQLILGMFVVLTAALSRLWRRADASTVEPAASTDRALSGLLVLALVGQLMLGVVLRKTGEMLLMHITMATPVVMLALAAGLRAFGLHGAKHAVLKRLGFAVSVLALVQVGLGLGALIVRETTVAAEVTVGSDRVAGAADAIVTTLHQVTGAGLLATSVLLAAWSFRLLKLPRVEPVGRPAATATG